MKAMAVAEIFDRAAPRLCAAIIANAGMDLQRWAKIRLTPRGRIALLSEQRLARIALDWLLGDKSENRLSFEDCALSIGVDDVEGIADQILAGMDQRALDDIDAKPVQMPDGKWCVCSDLAVAGAVNTRTTPGSNRKGRFGESRRVSEHTPREPVTRAFPRVAAVGR